MFSIPPGLARLGRSSVSLGILIVPLLAAASPASEEARLETSIFAEVTEATFEETPLSTAVRNAPAPPRAERDPAITRYAAELLRCEDLLDSIVDDPGLTRPSSAQGLLDLVNQDHALEAAGEALATKAAEWAGDPAATELIRARHREMLADHQRCHDRLLLLLELLRAAEDETERRHAIELLAAHFAAEPVTPGRRLATELDETVPLEREPTEVIVDEAELGLSDSGILLPLPDFGPLGLQAPPVAADLEETPDIEFTDEISALAAELEHSSTRIFDWVRRNIDFDPYVGSRRGAAETLRLRAGNDTDQASLLMALLRVSDIPCRYTTGTVEMKADVAVNWLGVVDPHAAGALLNTAGLDAVTIVNGADVTAIRCTRVWVEANVPYSDYRGAAPGQGESIWVRLDPAFKPYDNSFGTDVLNESGFDSDAFLASYLSSPNPNTILAEFESAISVSLGQQDPPLTLGENTLTREIAATEMPWLPASLPNKLISIDTSWSELPADRRYRIRVYVTGEGATLDHTVNLPEIAGKQVTLSYIGATTADQNAIAAAGGVFNIAQPWTIQVKPELRIDGCVVATGTGGVTLGKTQTSQIFFTDAKPGSVPQSISNKLIAGNYEGLAIDTGRVLVESENPELACPEDFTGGFLHKLGMLYLESNDRADRRVADIVNARIWKGVSNAILSQQIKVFYSGGTPLTFDYAGLSVDADRAGATPFSVYDADILYDYGRVRGAQSSQNENLVFEVNLGRESVSTIKILSLASLLNIPLFTIDQSNAATLIPQLNQFTSTTNDIIAQVNAGKVVTVPRDAFTYFDWSGTGYIQLDPASGAGGYIIDGGISGGATAEEDDKKPGCETVVSLEVTPPSAGNVYSTCQQGTVEITVVLTAYDGECDATGTRVVKKSIDPKTTQPGSYEFQFGSAGDCGCTPQTVTIVIKPGAVVYKDSNTPPRVAVNGLLEIAAPGSEVITATSQGKPDTQWSANGQITPTSQMGESVPFTYDIPGNAQFLPGAPLPFPAIGYFLTSNAFIAPSDISATNLTDECGADVSIHGYPSNAFKFSYNLNKKKRETAQQNLGELNDIVTFLDSVEDIMQALEEFADVLNAPFKFPPKPEGSGSIFITDQIKEVSNSNRVEYAVEIGVTGEFGVKGEVVVPAGAIGGIPPPLASASLIFPFGGGVGGKVSGGLNFEKPLNFKNVKFPQAEVNGRVFVGIGARASIASGFASLSITGTSGFSVAIPLSVSTEGSTFKLGGKLQVSIGGLTVAYETGAVWGTWTSSDSWQAIAPYKWPAMPETYYPIQIPFGS